MQSKLRLSLEKHCRHGRIKLRFNKISVYLVFKYAANLAVGLRQSRYFRIFLPCAAIKIGLEIPKKIEQEDDQKIYVKVILCF